MDGEFNSIGSGALVLSIAVSNVVPGGKLNSISSGGGRCCVASTSVPTSCRFEMKLDYTSGRGN